MKNRTHTGCKFFFPLEQHINFSLESVRSDLQKALLVIADLSFERPSCYFELGLARALGVPTYVIVTKGTRIHQTGTAEKALSYGDLEDYAAIIKRTVVSFS